MGSTTVAAPAPAQTATDALNAQLNIAPQQFAATQEFAPQYNDLYNQLAQSSLFGDANTQGLLATYSQAAPQLGAIQDAANQQQAGANIGLVNQYGAAATQAFQNANPNLTAVGNTYTQMATNPQNPVGQIGTNAVNATSVGADQWANGYNQQVGSTINANLVNPQSIQSSAGTLAGYTPAVSQVLGSQLNYDNSNPTVSQLNNTAQQQLALGTSMSPQETQTVANQVLSAYNQQGRANDPTAIAGLATGLDTYGQQLLQQRESAASTAGGLAQQQQSLGLQATTSQAGLNQAAALANQQALLSGSSLNLQNLTSQAGLQQQASLANQSTNLAGQQTNLGAAVSGLGLVGQADQAQSSQDLQAALANQATNLQAQGMTDQYGLQASMANQGAQLSNAQYQQALLSGAGQLDAATAQNPFSTILGQSGALSAASGAEGQAANSSSASQQLENLYNPFSNGAFSTIYGGQLQASQATAANNTAVTGAAVGAAGSAVGAL